MKNSLTDATRRWINHHAHPLLTLDPGGPLTDVAPLRNMVGDARLVALGVSTRDTHELSVISHRVVRLLVGELGFRSVVLEGDDATSVALNEYVRDGTGDPRALLAGARSFWRTAELLEVVVWLRQRNQRHPDDPVRVANMAENTRHALPQSDDLGQIERVLAENAIGWHELSGHKIVYLGGMAHTVSRAVSPGTTTHRNAGSYLRQHFGTHYVSVGLTFHHRTTSHIIPAPPTGFADAVLGGTDMNAYLLDLRVTSPAQVQSWLDRPAKTRLIGPFYDPDHDPAHHLTGGSLREWFDVIIHCQEVTGFRPLH